MGLTREEKVKRLRRMHGEIFKNISNCNKELNPLCFIYAKLYEGVFSDDIKKSRYFKPVGIGEYRLWFDSDIERLAALNDLIDMYTGYYKPTLKERLRNIVRYILFHF